MSIEYASGMSLRDLELLKGFGLRLWFFEDWDDSEEWRNGAQQT